MIGVWIDELTPCLKDNDTGELVDTEVIRLHRKSFLAKYNRKNHWFVSWAKLLDDNEVYAVVVRGTFDIQGLVAFHPDENQKAVFIAWMVTAPHNNKQLTDYPRYSGVGGHLFAIASEKSLEYGYGGVVTGNASNMDLVNHYCSVFQAEHIGMLHEFQIAIYEAEAAELRDIYDFEWTDEEI